MHRRTTAKVVGSLFITASVAGVLSVVVLGPLHASDALARASEHQGRLGLGALLVLVMTAAIAMIAPVVFPILKERNEALALGYVVFRTIEVVVLLPAAIIPLLLSRLSPHSAETGTAIDAAQFRTLRTVLLSYDNWGPPVGAVFFCAGAMLLNYLLYRWELVPRFISGWALVAVAPYLVDALLVMFGLLAISSALHAILIIPLALNEMVLAIWLLARGFAQPQALGGELPQLDDRTARLGSR